MSTFRAMLILPLAALFLSGCSKKEENVSTQAPVVRGEPINSAAAPVNTTSQVSKAESTTSNTATAETKTPAAASKTQPTAGNSEFSALSFDKLAGYTFNVPEGVVAGEQVGKSEEQIPKEVKEFDTKKVFVTGFMLPLKVDNGLVSELLLMKDQAMCCYGAIPRINDWVSVKMQNGGVKSVMDQPVTLYGKMRVGEMLENGYLVGIYEMAGEKMDVPKE